jgi:hypothetical protein
MPVPVIVAGFRAMFAPQSIYSDGLHLRGSNDAAPNKHMDALAVGLVMMMTGARPANDPAWTSEMIAQVDIVWTAIRDHACTGLGGSVVIEPTTAADPLPSPQPPATLVVTGGTITPFNRNGVDYTEILFQQSGSFTVSGDVPWHRRALGAGAGTGASGVGSVYLGGAGGAGGLDLAIDVPLAAGDYSVTIGAGGAKVTARPGSNSGSNSVLTNLTTSVSVTAIGGGYGGVSNSWASASSGGSGGGSRGQNGTTGDNSNFGSGTPGQGYRGGSGRNNVDGSLAASGGSGGAGGPGGSASDGVPGTAGPGILLDWIAAPRTVCAGERGILLSENGLDTPDGVFGSGSRGSIGGFAGKGGDGFLFLVVRADQVQVVQA